MKKVNSKLQVVFLIATIFSIVGCKLDTEDGKTNSNAASTKADFVGHCSKYLIVHKTKKDTKTKEDKTVIDSAVPASEGARDADVAKEKRSDELALFVAYTLEEMPDGTRNVSCSITDGGREYKNDAKIKGNKAYLSKNYCDIVYDLDGNNSFGTFTFEYSSDWAWIHYSDEETGYNFDVKFRNAECIEFQ